MFVTVLHRECCVLEGGEPGSRNDFCVDQQLPLCTSTHRLLWELGTPPPGEVDRSVSWPSADGCRRGKRRFLLPIRLDAKVGRIGSLKCFPPCDCRQPIVSAGRQSVSRVVSCSWALARRGVHLRVTCQDARALLLRLVCVIVGQ